MVISFSGIDGAGKTTQITMLEKYCVSHDIGYIKKWSKARGTPGIMFIKSIVRKDKRMNASDKQEYRENVYSNRRKRYILYLLSMLDLCWYWGIYFRIIKNRRELMILDRYIWDSYVEVSTEFGIERLDKKLLWKVVVFFSLKPDKAILLTIPSEESYRRDSLKNEVSIDSIEFKKKKLFYYQYLQKKDAWNVVLDSMKPVEETFSEILKELFDIGRKA